MGNAVMDKIIKLKSELRGNIISSSNTQGYMDSGEIPPTSSRDNY